MFLERVDRQLLCTDNALLNLIPQRRLESGIELRGGEARCIVEDHAGDTLLGLLHQQRLNRVGLAATGVAIDQQMSVVQFGMSKFPIERRLGMDIFAKAHSDTGDVPVPLRFDGDGFNRFMWRFNDFFYLCRRRFFSFIAGFTVRSCRSFFILLRAVVYGGYIRHDNHIYGRFVFHRRNGILFINVVCRCIFTLCLDFIPHFFITSLRRHEHLLNIKLSGDIHGDIYAILIGDVDLLLRTILIQPIGIDSAFPLDIKFTLQDVLQLLLNRRIFFLVVL